MPDPHTWACAICLSDAPDRIATCSCPTPRLVGPDGSYCRKVRQAWEIELRQNKGEAA